MKPCPKCERNRRVATYRKKISGVYYWITRCVECGTDISLEPIDPQPPEGEPKPKRGWFEDET